MGVTPGQPRAIDEQHLSDALVAALANFSPTSSFAAVAFSGSASDISVGTLPNARLSPQVARTDLANYFSQLQTFAGGLTIGTHPNSINSADGQWRTYFAANGGSYYKGAGLQPHTFMDVNQLSLLVLGQGGGVSIPNGGLTVGGTQLTIGSTTGRGYYNTSFGWVVPSNLGYAFSPNVDAGAAAADAGVFRDGTTGVKVTNGSAGGATKSIKADKFIASDGLSAFTASAGIAYIDHNGGGFRIRNANGGYANQLFFDGSGNLAFVGKLAVGLSANKTPSVDIVTGNNPGTYDVNDATTMRIRSSTTDGDCMTLVLGVSGSGGTGTAFIQPGYWGGSNSHPLRLSPIGGSVLIGDTGNLASGTKLQVNRSIVVSSDAPVGGATVGEYSFAPKGYNGKNASISAIYEPNWYQGMSLVFSTIQGADVAQANGIERMRIGANGNITMTGSLGVGGGVLANTVRSVAGNMFIGSPSGYATYMEANGTTVVSMFGSVVNFWTAIQAVNDNSVDIGGASNRFRDLRLGRNAYIDGSMTVGAGGAYSNITVTDTGSRSMSLGWASGGRYGLISNNDIKVEAVGQLDLNASGNAVHRAVSHYFYNVAGTALNTVLAGKFVASGSSTAYFHATDMSTMTWADITGIGMGHATAAFGGGWIRSPNVIDTLSNGFRIRNNAGTILVDVAAGGNVTASSYVTSKPQELNADPNTLDLPSGFERLVKNLSSGEIRRWFNDGGVMKKSLAYI